ncbi:hypothetical protein Amsp01_020200 [Amycolatopsis sp. NBRC 101858]|uniref:mycothiol transferase n=1 Tax=Amycolatopsis sp. NBRC 101858 TaxID=3032200 RepID=UPI0024A1F35B|nr:DUF664 domain-containing protein [Amycolatopsis sp. NBRC 101858]GLY35996.1 hypothetical protein Amsp01_020200 [Amycolatopsis sp. NBRC 101858]
MTDTDTTLVVDGDGLSTLLSTLDRTRRPLGEVLEQAAQRHRARRDPWDTAEPGAETPARRRIIADMIEEYARHTGHAGLLREAVDGLVGEDAPA